MSQSHLYLQPPCVYMYDLEQRMWRKHDETREEGICFIGIKKYRRPPPQKKKNQNKQSDNNNKTHRWLCFMKWNKRDAEIILSDKNLGAVNSHCLWHLLQLLFLSAGDQQIKTSAVESRLMLGTEVFSFLYFQ